LVKRHLLSGFLLLSLSACATSYQRGPASVEDRTLGGQKVPKVPQEVVNDGSAESDVVESEIGLEPVKPIAEEPVIILEPLRPTKDESPVVESLLASADEQTEIGDSEAAANSLERALRIEPRNATLWSRLAEIHFDQQQFQQAIQLAAKSNVMSGENQHLRRRNWYLMANSYDELGDFDSARKYREKVIATKP